MIHAQCKLCKSITEIDESEYKPGSHVVVNCDRCGEDIEIDIPGDPEEIEEITSPESQVPAVADAIEPVSGDSVSRVGSEAVQAADPELERARMVLEAERIKLEHRRMEHEERMRQADLDMRQGVPEHAYVQAGKSKVTAALLAIFLGGFGVHKFYLGKTGQGVLYLIFCWTYIPSLIGFIEGIVYLTKSDSEFQASYQ